MKDKNHNRLSGPSEKRTMHTLYIPDLFTPLSRPFMMISINAGLLFPAVIATCDSC